MKTRVSIRLSLAALAGVSLSGCASSYRFQVEAVKNVEAPVVAQSFEVVSANPEIETSDLRFIEAAEYVKAALSSKGLYEAPAGTEADMIVEVDFGIEGPEQEIRTYFVPAGPSPLGDLRGQRGSVSNSLISPVLSSEGMFARGDFDDMSEEQVLIVVTVYNKFLRISARESPTSEGDRVQREIWSVLVLNRDESNDLRKYVPLLVTAAMDHVNEDLAEPENVILTDEDTRVAFVRRGM